MHISRNISRLVLFAIIINLVFAAPATDSMAAPEAACNADAAQVGCWQMEEGSGTTLVDGSGNGNNAATTGSPTWGAGYSGLALVLNGTSQYAAAPHSSSLNVSGPITLAAWVKPASALTTQYLVKKATLGSTDGYELSLASSGVAFFRLNQSVGPDTYRVNTTSLYPADGNTWMHLAGVYDGSTLKIFVNGVMENSIAGPTTIATNSTPLGIGAQSDGASSFNGAIDDLRIYSRALSAAEIKAIIVDRVPSSYPNCTALAAVAGSANTGEKPQSKAWYYQGKWWSVFPTSAGAQLWRLDGSTWTSVLTLSSRTGGHTDAKPAGSPVGSVVHILLYEGSNTALASAQYSTGSYVLWSGRPGGLSPVALAGSETATIDIDSTGRMWLASETDALAQVVLYYSDSPYSSWTGPLALASGISTDDISVVTALPNNTIGVLWSNQNTQRYGFRYHVDGANASTWSTDEVPASQSALNVGGGMADDHLNVAVDSNGTLYAAVKTSYDISGYPKIAMMVRRLSGSSGGGNWDNLYEISQTGTRGIAVLDESAGVINILYTSSEGSGNILYKQASIVQPLSFTAAFTMRSGGFNDASSTKQNLHNEILALYSNGNSINGSLCTGSPNAVDLAWFTAEPQPGGMRLEWQTASEVDLLGFNLLRSRSPDRQPVQLNAALLPAQTPGLPVNNSYQFTDTQVDAGLRYSYWIELVDRAGNKLQGPVEARSPYWLFLPLALKK